MLDPLLTGNFHFIKYNHKNFIYHLPMSVSLHVNCTVALHVCRVAFIHQRASGAGGGVPAGGRNERDSLQTLFAS